MIETMKRWGNYLVVGAIAVLGFLFLTKGKNKSEPIEEDVRVKDLLSEKGKLMDDNKEALKDASTHIEQAKDAIDSIEDGVAKIKAGADNKIEMKVADWNS